MPFFCSCRICKINSKDGNGKWLSTKKTFKRHQKREKANIEKINGSEAESGSELKQKAIVNQFQVVMQLKKERSKMMNWINQIQVQKVMFHITIIFL